MRRLLLDILRFQLRPPNKLKGFKKGEEKKSLSVFKACARNKFCYFAFKNSFLDLLEPCSCRVHVKQNKFFPFFFSFLLLQDFIIEIEFVKLTCKQIQ